MRWLIHPICLLAVLTGGVASAQQKPSTTATELDAVTAVATRGEQTLFESSATVTIIDTKDLERRNVESMRDAVRLEPGVDVGNQNGRTGQTGYTIRGVGDNRVRIQIDGVKVPDMPETFVGGAALYSRDFVDFDSLKRIEIVRGPASALYGSDALGGVVAYVTKDPKDYLDIVGKDWYTGIKFGYDSTDRSFMETGAVAGRLGMIEASLQFTRRDGNETQPQGHIYDYRPAYNPITYDSENYLGKLVVNISPEDKLKLTAEYLTRQLDTDIQTDIALPTVRSSRGDDNVQRYRFSAEYNRDAPFFFVDNLMTRTYATRVDRSELTDQDRFSAGAFRLRHSDFDYVQTIGGYELQMKTGADTGPLAHMMTYGLDNDWTWTSRPRERFEKNRTTGVITTTVAGEQFPNKNFPDTSVYQIGGYIQDEMKWQRLTVTPAVRVSYYHLYPNPDREFANSNTGNFKLAEVEQTSITPKLGATYKVDDNYLAFTQYARGLRNPPYDEANFGFRNAAQGYEILPAYNLKPEQADNIEGGLRGRYTDGSSFAVSGFYNFYRNFIEQQQVGISNTGLLQFQAKNVRSVAIYGIEGKGEWRFLPEWALVGSAAFARGTNEDRDRPIDTVAPLTIVGGIKYDDPDGWGGKLTTKKVWEHDRVSDPTYFRAPGYTFLDLYGYYDLGTMFSLNAGVLNILDHHYWNHLDVVGTAWNSATVERASAPGRTFFVSAAMRW